MTLIVRDTAGQVFICTEVPGIDHAWSGVPAKLAQGFYVPKVKAARRLVRKAGCTIIASR